LEGGCPLSEKLRPHLTQCGRDRGLPASQVSSWSIKPFGYSTPTSQTGQTDRQDRQRSDSVGQTALQTATQKCFLTKNGSDAKTRRKISACWWVARMSMVEEWEWLDQSAINFASDSSTVNSKHAWNQEADIWGTTVNNCCLPDLVAELNIWGPNKNSKDMNDCNLHFCYCACLS